MLGSCNFSSEAKAAATVGPFSPSAASVPTAPPNCSAETSFACLRDTRLLAMNRVEPSGNFQTQSYGAGLLQPGAAGEQSGLMRFGDSSERAGKLRKFALQQIQSVAQLQDQAGINRVLAGGAPVDETSGLRIGFRDRRGERLHQRNRQISGEGCFARQDVQRKMIRAALRDDWRNGSCLARRRRAPVLAPSAASKSSMPCSLR